MDIDTDTRTDKVRQQSGKRRFRFMQQITDRREDGRHREREVSNPNLGSLLVKLLQGQDYDFFSLIQYTFI